MSFSRMRVFVGVAAVVGLAACSSERVAGPDGSLTKCAPSAVFGSFGDGTPGVGVSASVPSLAARGPRLAAPLSVAPLSVAPLSGAVVSYPAPSAQFNDTAARYLVVPQYPVQGSAPDSTPFRLTAGEGAVAVAPAFVGEEGGQVTAQGALDLRLRRIEAGLPVDAGLAPGPARAAAAAPDSIRSFYVLGSLTENCFVQTQARLKYTGARVYVYEDTGVSSGFSPSEYAKFGTLFDDVLYPIDTAAFGFPSDVDGNGHIIVLLSQKINQLTSRADCQTSGAYVARLLLRLRPDERLGLEPERDLLLRRARLDGAVQLRASQEPGRDADADDVRARVPAHDLVQPARADAEGTVRGHLAERGAEPHRRGARVEVLRDEVSGAGRAHGGDAALPRLVAGVHQPGPAQRLLLPPRAAEQVGDHLRRVRHARGARRGVALPPLAGRPEGRPDLQAAGGDDQARDGQRRERGGGAVPGAVRRLRHRDVHGQHQRRAAHGGADALPLHLAQHAPDLRPPVPDAAEPDRDDAARLQRRGDADDAAGDVVVLPHRRRRGVHAGRRSP